MKKRGDGGMFVSNGGRLSEKRDKPCPDCGKMIMRKSTKCRSCSQSGSLGNNWNGGVKPCTECGAIRKNHSPSPLCKDCFKGENHFAWKGDDVGYVALHCWVRKKLGKPSKCEICGTRDSKRFEWANISGEYNRDVSDFMELCKSCHIKYDKLNINNSVFKEKYV